MVRVVVRAYGVPTKCVILVFRVQYKKKKRVNQLASQSERKKKKKKSEHPPRAFPFLPFPHIRKTPNPVFSMGAFSAALRLRPRVMRVSRGSITPSSHNLAEL